MIKDYGQSPSEVAKIAEKWTDAEMSKLFIVHSFSAPYCRVTRKSDQAEGWLEFGHSPRFYFNFAEIK